MHYSTILATPKQKTKLLTVLLLGLALTVIMLLFGSTSVKADDHKVEICHATGSNSNPYSHTQPPTRQEVAKHAVVSGHGDHTGPIFPDTNESGEWGDIIPPFEAHEGSGESGWEAFDGLNWTEEGQAIWNNHCDVPTDEEETPGIPSVLASILACVPQSNDTDRVSVAITNTDDETDAAVDYTAVVGSQNKVLNDLADGLTGSLIFSGLPVGSYRATVTGDDGTQATSNQVNVTLCAGGGGGGQVLGDVIVREEVRISTAQVTAPVGGVKAGGGGVSGSITGSLYGLGASLSAVGYGVSSLLKKQ